MFVLVSRAFAAWRTRCSTACHAEGRGFESLQPLLAKAPQIAGFFFARMARTGGSSTGATTRRYQAVRSGARECDQSRGLATSVRLATRGSTTQRPSCFGVLAELDGRRKRFDAPSVVPMRDAAAVGFSPIRQRRCTVAATVCRCLLRECDRPVSSWHTTFSLNTERWILPSAC